MSDRRHTSSQSKSDSDSADDLARESRPKRTHHKPKRYQTETDSPDQTKNKSKSNERKSSDSKQVGKESKSKSGSRSKSKSNSRSKSKSGSRSKPTQRQSSDSRSKSKSDSRSKPRRSSKSDPSSKAESKSDSKLIIETDSFGPNVDGKWNQWIDTYNSVAPHVNQKLNRNEFQAIKIELEQASIWPSQNNFSLRGRFQRFVHDLMIFLNTQYRDPLNLSHRYHIVWVLEHYTLFLQSVGLDSRSAQAFHDRLTDLQLPPLPVDSENIEKPLSIVDSNPKVMFDFRNRIIVALRNLQPQIEHYLLEMMERRSEPYPPDLYNAPAVPKLNKSDRRFAQNLLRCWIEVAMRLVNIPSRPQASRMLQYGRNTLETSYVCKLVLMHRRFYRIWNRDKVHKQAIHKPVMAPLDDTLSIYLFCYIYFLKEQPQSPYVYGSEWNHYSQSLKEFISNTLAIQYQDIDASNFFIHRTRHIMLASYGGLTNFEHSLLVRWSVLMRHTSHVAETKYAVWGKWFQSMNAVDRFHHSWNSPWQSNHAQDFLQPESISPVSHQLLARVGPMMAKYEDETLINDDAEMNWENTHIHAVAPSDVPPPLPRCMICGAFYRWDSKTMQVARCPNGDLEPLFYAPPTRPGPIPCPWKMSLTLIQHNENDKERKEQKESTSGRRKVRSSRDEIYEYNMSDEKVFNKPLDNDDDDDDVSDDMQSDSDSDSDEKTNELSNASDDDPSNLIDRKELFVLGPHVKTFDTWASMYIALRKRSPKEYPSLSMRVVDQVKHMVRNWNLDDLSIWSHSEQVLSIVSNKIEEAKRMNKIITVGTKLYLLRWYTLYVKSQGYAVRDIWHLVTGQAKKYSGLGSHLQQSRFGLCVLDPIPYIRMRNQLVLQLAGYGTFIIDPFLRWMLAVQEYSQEIRYDFGQHVLRPWLELMMRFNNAPLSAASTQNLFYGGEWIGDDIPNLPPEADQRQGLLLNSACMLVRKGTTYYRVWYQKAVGNRQNRERNKRSLVTLSLGQLISTYMYYYLEYCRSEFPRDRARHESSSSSLLSKIRVGDRVFVGGPQGGKWAHVVRDQLSFLTQTMKCSTIILEQWLSYRLEEMSARREMNQEPMLPILKKGETQRDIDPTQRHKWITWSQMVSIACQSYELSSKTAQDIQYPISEIREWTTLIDSPFSVIDKYHQIWNKWTMANESMYHFVQTFGTESLFQQLGHNHQSRVVVQTESSEPVLYEIFKQSVE